ncbi:MAG TPA: hypothetical protein VHZ56_03565 [Devosia sp.]|jgi:hypothetical protein|nr:hypothetical protein [Devosia sp.]
MLASQIIKVPINRPYAEVYEFLSDPVNFPRWAANPGSDIVPMGGNDYLVELPAGQRVIRFAPRNPFGVLDYQTFDDGRPSGPPVPVRLYANGEGCELVLFWLQREGISEERFRSDAEWVGSDLQRLKTLLEGG